MRERETRLDMLISNAGIRRDPSIACNPLTASLSELQTSLLSSSYSDWLSSFQVNTMPHYFLSVSLLDLLAAAGERTLEDGTKGRESGCGVVVVTSSIASLHNATNVDMMSYATTKAATDHLVSLLAAKFARWYVRVVGINPGCTSPTFLSPCLRTFSISHGNLELCKRVVLTKCSCTEQHESHGHWIWRGYFWRLGE